MVSGRTPDALAAWAEGVASRRGETRGRRCLRFAFYGRVSTEDWQDPVTSRARQLQQALMLVAGRGVIVAEFFDAGESRVLPWARRPQAAAVVAQFADPDRGWDAIVIGEYERAFYGSQYASMAPLFEHYGVGLWMPEVGRRVDWHAEDHEQTMLALGLSSKRKMTRTRIRVRTAMAAISELADPFARTGLTVLRGTGIRLGELLDLELDCIWDSASHGSWLKVPLGKLATERTVPLDEPTLAALDQWMTRRGPQRALPHPRLNRPADFLFTERGRRLTAFRLRRGLDDAAAAAGLRGRDGQTMHATPHQLRHTYVTSLINSGMSLQALMALLGHVSTEMTLRYAALAAPAVRTAYEEAMGKARARLTLAIAPPASPSSPAGWNGCAPRC